MLSYGVAALSAIFSAFCYVEFAVEMPIAGGGFVYVKTVFGEFPAWCETAALFSKSIVIHLFRDTLILQLCFVAMKVNGFRGKLAVMSAKTNHRCKISEQGGPMTFDSLCRLYSKQITLRTAEKACVFDFSEIAVLLSTYYLKHIEQCLANGSSPCHHNLLLLRYDSIHSGMSSTIEDVFTS